MRDSWPPASRYGDADRAGVSINAGCSNCQGVIDDIKVFNKIFIYHTFLPGFPVMMKAAIPLVLAGALLAGCTASGDIAAPPIPPVGLNEPGPKVGIGEAVHRAAPVALAPGSSPIPPGKQVAFCQDQVAFMHGVEAQSATTGQREVAADGSTSIHVTVDKGTEGLKSFECRLDASGRFVDVIAAL